MEGFWEGRTPGDSLAFSGYEMFNKEKPLWVSRVLLDGPTKTLIPG